MKIGDEVYIHGYVDEIRNDVVIIRNEGGYFGTVPSEVKLKTETQTGNKLYKIEESSVCKDELQTINTFAMEKAIAKCKVRHNNCKSCDKKCIFDARVDINDEPPMDEYYKDHDDWYNETEGINEL